ncbi:MAG TPA: hypothetical protein PLM75_02705 [bacterium]|nr:hypothetical protein [bacterium]
MKKYNCEYCAEFIEFISELSKKHSSFKWWCSTVSEKNVVIEDSLYKILNELIFERKDFDELLNYKFSLKKYYKVRRRFIAEKIQKMQAIPKLDLSKKYIGLMTWLDKRNFDESGNFKETYYQRLFEELRDRDDFLLLIYPLYTIGDEQANKLLKNLNIPYLDIFKYYKKIDVIKAILFSLYYMPLKEKEFFREYDITKILRYYFKREICENHYANYYLMYYSIMRLAEAGVKFERIIYPFENQPWEKILCYAARKFMPETKLIAYMHTMTLPNLVSIFAGRYESENMPQPDYIFTTGKLSAVELRKFWQAEKVIENCAMRYEYLFNMKTDRIIDTDKKKLSKYILLALSVDYKKSIEMMKIVYSAFKNSSDFNIIIKPHPTYNLEAADLTDYGLANIVKENCAAQREKKSEQSNDLKNIANQKTKFSISDRPVSELLPKCEIVITAESTVGLEGIKLGLVMIELEIDGFIPLSRLEYSSEIKIVVKTADELYQKVEEILNWSKDKRADYFKKANEFINYCFNIPEEKYIKKFVEI